MRWHAELLVEVALFFVLYFRTNLRWFEVLLGSDLVAQLLQLLLYRYGFHELSRLVWVSAVVIRGPIRVMALCEAANHWAEDRVLWRRHMILMAVWSSVVIACLALQTQPGMLYPANHALIISQMILFGLWAWLFYR